MGGREGVHGQSCMSCMYLVCACCMYVCMYACMYVFMYVLRMCIYTYMCVCLHCTCNVFEVVWVQANMGKTCS